MEDFITILEFIAMIFAGMATALPLISKVIKTADELRRSRNWSKMLGIVLDLMEEAEGLMIDGADRKAWVMGGVERLADSVEYDIDMEEVSTLIDNLCEMSKKVNSKEE